MSNTIPEIVTQDDPVDTVYDSSNKYIPIEDIIEYCNKGLSYREIGELLGCSKQNISQRLDAIGYAPERLKNFHKNRADIFSFLQSKILNSIDEDAIQKAPLNLKVVSAGILYDKERLERGKSSQNISIVEVQGSIKELQDQADKLRQSL